MMKKTLNKAEISFLHIGQGMWTDGPGVSNKDTDMNPEIGGVEGAPVRQITDFFGNTVLVPTDAEDWE